ncbi:AAA family ATPase [Actinoplanes hulinensis]|uniref:AAA family ATPase n=1 Tax=Actinoplanes hulinensis TaxID=1144547 RepID=A0ABS7AZ85_9ACTN|nr:AAA family ATPase [Actinoplanes hulinensis]MBW6434086.1 AAA family ATPase [Actinoplanes hulinensis]
MDGTETGWGRPAEPAPRWRALLDRARHGGRGEESEETPQQPETPPQQQWNQQQQPSRGSAAVERRPFNPLDPRQAALDGRQQGQPQPGGFERRAPEPPAERAVPQRPINPLDPRWQRGREPEQQHSFFEPAPRTPQQQPAQPPAQPPAREYGAPTGYPQQNNGYPPPGNGYQPPPANGYAPPAGAYGAQAAAYPQAPVAPPPVPPQTSPPQAPVRQPAAQPAPVRQPAAQPAPVSPAPAAARIEWRQSRTEDGMDRAVSIMRRKLGKPRVLAFANPKGGVHKTTATVLAAATIGSVRGRGVLAWDDNELRGTLGLRAGSARHARTIKHLLADLMRIESLHGDVLLQELDAYLRHASDGSYDVLAGEENPRFAQRLDQGTVRRVMDLLRRTHDVICVDTGNNVESVNWQTVMRSADQLVITTVPREDAAFTADWMLDVLEESGMGDMVSNAVTLISCPSAGHLPLLEDFKKHFATRTRAVAVVPYDPALEVGSSIEYGDLQQETRQAWLRAASTMLEPFAE